MASKSKDYVIVRDPLRAGDLVLPVPIPPGMRLESLNSSRSLTLDRRIAALIASQIVRLDPKSSPGTDLFLDSSSWLGLPAEQDNNSHHNHSSQAAMTLLARFRWKDALRIHIHIGVALHLERSYHLSLESEQTISK
jgi:hypothetical protein